MLKMLHNPYSSHYFQVPHVSVPYHGDIPNGKQNAQLLNYSC
jgi:hypothetical protein